MSYNTPVNGNVDFCVSTGFNLANLVVGNQKVNKIDCVSQLYTIISYNGNTTILDPSSDSSVPSIIEGPPSYYQCNGATVSTNFVTKYLLPTIQPISIPNPIPNGQATLINYYMYLGPYIEIIT